MQTAAALLGRKPHRPPPALTLWDEVALTLARVHEICGPARHSLAMHLARAAKQEVFWIAPAYGSEALNPCGMAELADPGRFTFVSPRAGADLLWCMEEVLRAGCVPLVICELPEPPPMTPVRRLHLAAETGATQGFCRPLGLILTPGDGGAAGVESRWHMAPDHRPGSDIWRLERRRARMQPPKTWRLEGDMLQDVPGTETGSGPGSD